MLLSQVLGVEKPVAKADLVSGESPLPGLVDKGSKLSCAFRDSSIATLGTPPHDLAPLKVPTSSTELVCQNVNLGVGTDVHPSTFLGRFYFEEWVFCSSS